MNDKIKVTLVSKAVAEAEIIISCQWEGTNVIQFASDAEPWGTPIEALPSRSELRRKMYPDAVEIKPDTSKDDAG